MTFSLPIIPDCRGCGACCLTQGTPPMYAYLLSIPNEPPDKYDYGDRERVNNLPEELKEELRAYVEDPNIGPFDNYPCIWLDLKTRQCRHYELRPSICRLFEPGSPCCLDWREEYGVS